MKKEKGHKKRNNRAVITGLMLFLFLALYLVLKREGGDASELLPFLIKLIRPIIRMIFFVSLGLFLGQLLEGSGLTSSVGILARPFVSWAHLPASSGASFTLAFASGVTANTLLYSSYKDKVINRKELIMANLLNSSLPVYLLHMPTTLFIILPLIGMAGVWYMGLTFLAALLRFFAVLIISRLIFLKREEQTLSEKKDRPKFREILRITWPKFKVRIKRMIMIIVPIYLVIFLASDLGFFPWLKLVLAKSTADFLFPVEAMSVIVITLAAEFTSGFAAAGALLEAGSLTMKEVILALLAGNIIGTPVRALRHQVPHYMGIFTPALGGTLLALGQGFRVLSVLIVTILFALLK